MKSKLRILSVLAIATLLVAGWDFHPKVSATVPGTNKVVELNTSGGNPNVGSSGISSLSHNGRYVAFTSSATNLVSGVTVSGTYHEIYLRDRLTNTTSLVSVSSSGVAANSGAEGPVISDDGRYVVYVSRAGNLTDTISCSTTCDYQHVFVRDIKNSTTDVVDTNTGGTVDYNSRGAEPTISADGRYVVFTSNSTNLVSTPSLSAPSGYDYIYRKDLSTGAVKLLSVGMGASAPNNTSGNPKIDCGGDRVAFYSDATNLVSGDTNGKEDTFIYDAINDSLKNITINGDDNSAVRSISCNGEYVTLTSTATNLTGSTISSSDLQAYSYDRVNDAFSLVSKSSSGSVASGGVSWPDSISDDGRAVLFYSYASNLVGTDTNGGGDIFLRSTEQGTTEMLDVDSSGAQANGYIGNASMSADGRYVSYTSGATNLVSGLGVSGGITYVSETGYANSY